MIVKTEFKNSAIGRNSLLPPRAHGNFLLGFHRLVAALLLLLLSSVCSCSDDDDSSESQSREEASGDQTTVDYYMCDCSDSSELEYTTSPFGPTDRPACLEFTGTMPSEWPEINCERNMGTGSGLSMTDHCKEPAPGCYCAYDYSSTIRQGTYEYLPDDITSDEAAAIAASQQKKCMNTTNPEFRCFGIPGF